MSWRWILFGLVCLAQLAVPVSLVVRHEQTRASGTPWRFQVAPLDPADPFRGKYVRLSYAVERDAVPLAGGAAGFLGRGRRAYAELARGPDGFAQLVRVHERRPVTGDYVDVFVQYMDAPEGGPRDGVPRVVVRMPFDRYYLTEARAPEVERRYFEASRNARDNTWAEVRVRDGHGALVALVLDGQPVEPPR